MKRRWLGCVLVSLSCQDKGDEPVGEVTWYKDIQPIVGENCQACHNASDPMGGAYPFESHAEVQAWSGSMLAKMAIEGDDQPPYFMPPVNSRETAECEIPLPLKGTYHADEDEVALFQSWVDAGMPEGDSADSTPYVVPEPSSLTGANLSELGFSAPYLVPTDEGADVFRCLAVESADGLASMLEDTWVTGIEFEPGYTPVVHHVLAYVIEDLDSHLQNGLVEDEDTNSWACQGSPSRSDGSYSLPDYDLVYAWVPGTLPLEFEEETAIRIPEGAGIVLDMHYNLLALGSDDVPLDDSKFIIQTGDEPTNEAVMHIFGVAAEGQANNVDEPPFLVPPNTAGHVESFTETYPSIPDSMDIRSWGYTPHMHLAGTDIKLTHTKASGDEGCIAHVPKWDYNWQQLYSFDASFDELPRIEQGDSLQVRCTMDNTDDNPFYRGTWAGRSMGMMGKASFWENEPKTRCV